MAAMDAVEVANGQRDGAMPVGAIRQSTKNLHFSSRPKVGRP
jgi:hypothetical protein